MKVSDNTTRKIFLASWVSLNPANASDTNITAPYSRSSESDRDILQPLRLWIDNIKVSDRTFAHRLCKLIPAQCPFERDVKLFGKTLVSHSTDVQAQSLIPRSGWITLSSAVLSSR